MLRHIFASIHVKEPWYPVFVRYLGQIEDRVRAFGGDPDRVVPSPSGSLPEPKDKKPDAESFEGKVVQVIYDCFGDFKAFVLEDCRGKKAFSCCETGIEKIVLRACKDRCILRVTTEKDRSERIISITIKCC